MAWPCTQHMAHTCSGGGREKNQPAHIPVPCLSLTIGEWGMACCPCPLPAQAHPPQSLQSQTLSSQSVPPAPPVQCLSLSPCLPPPLSQNVFPPHLFLHRLAGEEEEEKATRRKGRVVGEEYRQGMYRKREGTKERMSRRKG